MRRRDPFKGHRFPKDVILLAVRWYCRFPLSYRDVRDLLEERGIPVDAATIWRWVVKFGPEIRKQSYSKHRSWRGLQWHVDETYLRVNGRWCYLWRAVDQRGQLIDFRLTATRNAKAAKAFFRQAQDTVRLYHPMTTVTDKAPTYAKVIRDMNRGCDPADQIRHTDRKHLNSEAVSAMVRENSRTIESDHAVLKRLLGRHQSFRSLRSAKATLQGIETLRTIKKG